ncbi:hypothetical protein FC41_GL001055 [Lactobacillus hominis DSM 23910 = CRBIP 24.179]|nr:hypothetical protein FC41_GL001055 [Lactobacillus hominis DSM 23910 = CRBIP 24.179]
MPDYYDGVYEMVELLKAQSKTLSEIEDNHTRSLLNEFVTQADEKGISIFEDQLGIKPGANDTLETRRNKVLMYGLPPQPITVRYLQNLFKISSIPAEVSVDYHQRTVIISAKSAEISASQLDYMKYLLNVSIPANMLYEVKIALNNVELTDDWFIGIGMTSRAELTVGADLSQVYN